MFVDLWIYWFKYGNHQTKNETNINRISDSYDCSDLKELHILTSQIHYFLSRYLSLLLLYLIFEKTILSYTFWGIFMNLPTLNNSDHFKVHMRSYLPKQLINDVHSIALGVQWHQPQPLLILLFSTYLFLFLLFRQIELVHYFFAQYLLNLASNWTSRR